MQKLLFIILISITAYTSSFSQAPVVIKQDSSVRDLDEEQDIRDLPFRQRLRFGGGINSLSFTSYRTSIGVSPMVGYQVTNNFTVGFALDYIYQKYSLPNYSISENQFGPRLFGQRRITFLEAQLANLFPESMIQVYGQAEFQKFYASQSGYSYTSPVQALGGIGIGLGGFQIIVLRNFAYNSSSSAYYSSPWVFRVGGFFF